LQRGCRNQQIFESDADTLGGLVAFDASGQLRCLNTDRVNGDIADQFIDDALPPLPALFCIRPMDAVRQFHDSHLGEANLDFSVAGFELLKYLPNAVAQPLGCNDDGRVED
jgi:hypothetical protein